MGGGGGEGVDGGGLSGKASYVGAAVQRDGRVIRSHRGLLKQDLEAPSPTTL